MRRLRLAIKRWRHEGKRLQIQKKKALCLCLTMKIWSRRIKRDEAEKAQRRDCHVADMVDVICSNDNFSRKLIFTNSKNTRNNEVYVQVLKEVEKRYTGSSSFPFSTGQMRTKFKRCVAECKKLALTIKTATGVKRIQEDRGYGPWFNQLFSLVQSRDSCNPELAEEPSSSRNASSSASTETSPEDEGKNLFVPRKRSKEKKKKEDIMTSVVEVLKDMSQQDTTADLRKFFREENERANSAGAEYGGHEDIGSSSISYFNQF